MRNVVSKFIGKNEKELNQDLVKMSLYYGFDITVTSKIYYNKILIYSNNEFVCEHKKIDGNKKISANIRHYLKTLILDLSRDISHRYEETVSWKNSKNM